MFTNKGRSIVNKAIHVALVSLMTVTSVIGIQSVPTARANDRLEEGGVNKCLFYIQEERNRQDLITPEEGSSNDAGGLMNGVNIDSIYNFMHNEYGLSAKFIAGIIGNFYQESKLDPRTVEGYYDYENPNYVEEYSKPNTGKTTKGIGLGQWTFERHQDLVDFAESKYGDKYKWVDMTVQLDFMFTGDSMYRRNFLQEMAEDDGRRVPPNADVVDYAISFHKWWEGSADSEQVVREVRGENAKKVYAYMTAKGMTGEKDLSKTAKIANGSSDGSMPDVTTTTGELNDLCGVSGMGNAPTGNIGDSVAPNGKVAIILGGAWTYEQVPENLKQYITLPQFPSNFDYSTSPFNISAGLRGQCTELTWIMMNQLYDGNQPATGDGGFVWKSYEAQGADITNQPTVGYGFSALYPNAGASNSPYGHTGLVAGVLPDGSWIGLNFNWGGQFRAPSRIPFYTHVAGSGQTSNPVKFFSGVGEAKVPVVGENN